MLIDSTPSPTKKVFLRWCFTRQCNFLTDISNGQNLQKSRTIFWHVLINICNGKKSTFISSDIKQSNSLPSHWSFCLTCMVMNFFQFVFAISVILFFDLMINYVIRFLARLSRPRRPFQSPNRTRSGTPVIDLLGTRTTSRTTRIFRQHCSLQVAPRFSNSLEPRLKQEVLFRIR